MSHSCQYCQQLLLRPEHFKLNNDRAREEGNYVDFEISITDIGKACEANCPLFNTFTSQRTAGAHWSTLKGNFKFPECRFHDGCDLEFSVQIPGKGSLVSKWQLIVDKSNPAADWVHTRPINRFPDTAATYELAKSWISECLTAHAHRNVNSTGYMPTRLIHESKRGSEFLVQLVYSSKTEGSASYCALSYCWGGDQPQKLTSKFMEEGRRLDYDNLPATIQDAVRTTASLGFEYLWVDSMCIIQDDEDDKRREIPRMCDVYSNSVVTIAAAASSSVFGGFLGQRACSTQQIIAVLPFQHPDGTKTVVGLYPYVDDISERSHVASSLDKRGWILQERLLSMRTLEFRKDQLRFSCPSIGNRRGYRDGGQDGCAPFFGDDVMSKLNTLPAFFDSPSALFRQWADIVHAYTHRSLTVPADRINAISGIATKVGSMLVHADSYVTGHWTSRLVPSLMWASNRGHQTDRLLTRTPTWSWLSVDSAVSYNHLKTRFSEEICLCGLEWPITVLNVHAEPQDAIAPYGAFKHAVLTLRGLVKHIRTHVGSRASSGTRSFYRFPCAEESPSPEKIDLLEDTAQGGTDLRDETMPIDLLLTRQQAFTGRNSSRNVYAIGLILKRVHSGADEGRYARIGWWGFYWKDVPLDESGLGSSEAHAEANPILRILIDRLGFEETDVELV